MSDVFRKNYRSLTDAEKELLENIKDAAAVFYDIIDQKLPSREFSLAKTKLEEAVFWAVKAVTKES